jgi:hypothetical protein
MAAGIALKNNIRKFLDSTALQERESIKTEILDALFPETDSMIRGSIS